MTLKQHNDIVDTIHGVLRQRKDKHGKHYYLTVDKNVEYGYYFNDDKKHHKGQITGEIDVLTVRKELVTYPEYQSQLENEIIGLYEVKTGNKNEGKAKEQMKRAEKHLRENYLNVDDVVNKYYVPVEHNGTFDIYKIGETNGNN